VRPLDGLLQSYLDLRWHFDPAAASAAGVVSADARLGAFDPQAMREHLAAFRAVAAGIEDLDLEALDDEIDRTALLAEVRATVARFEEDRPQVRDPGFWVGHVRDAVASLLGRPAPEVAAAAALARLAAVPAFLETGRASLRRPPLVLVDAALAQLGPVGELLVRAAWEFGRVGPAGADGVNAAVKGALQALAGFGAALREEIEPESDWTRTAIGQVRYERRMQEAYAVRSSVAELGRWAAETLAAPGPASDTPGVFVRGDELAAAQARTAAGLTSPVRRALRSPVAVEGWALYAAGVGAESSPEWGQRLRRAAGRLAADVGLHAGGTDPTEAARVLVRSGFTPEEAEREVRSIAAEPTRGLAAAAGYRDILPVRRAFLALGADRTVDGFHEAILAYGALPPSLAAWGMGLDREAGDPRHR
jgi:hypothetical protein